MSDLNNFVQLWIYNILNNEGDVYEWFKIKVDTCKHLGFNNNQIIFLCNKDMEYKGIKTHVVNFDSKYQLREDEVWLYKSLGLIYFLENDFDLPYDNIVYSDLDVHQSISYEFPILENKVGHVSYITNRQHSPKVITYKNKKYDVDRIHLHAGMFFFKRKNDAWKEHLFNACKLHREVKTDYYWKNANDETLNMFDCVLNDNLDEMYKKLNNQYMVFAAEYDQREFCDINLPIYNIHADISIDVYRNNVINDEWCSGYIKDIFKKFKNNS